jgi:hypothetical protein
MEFLFLTFCGSGKIVLAASSGPRFFALAAQSGILAVA